MAAAVGTLFFFTFLTEILSQYIVFDIFFKKTKFQLLLPLVFEIFEIFEILRFWDFSCAMEGMRKVMAA